MVFDLSQFHAVFFDEAGEHLAIIGTCLEGLDPAREASAAIDEAYRCAHSIKGASATFGFDEMSGLGRALCELLQGVRQGQVLLDDAIITACRDAHGVLTAQLAARRSGATAADVAAGGIVDRLQALGTDSPGDMAAGIGMAHVDTSRGAAGRSVAGLHETAAAIGQMLARMEALSREHAALVAQTAATVREFERQMRDLLEGPAFAGDMVRRQATVAIPRRPKSTKMAAMRPAQRSCGAPVPKVKESAQPRRSLEQEWEEF
jgi:two-component system chemotaxis sensor kinase CheA